MKNKFTSIKNIVLGLTITLNSAYSFADTIISAAGATQGVSGSSGLTGQYWKVDARSTDLSIEKTLNLINSNKVNGTFISSDVNYSGRDFSTIKQFIGNDGNSFVGLNNSMSDGIVKMDGFIKITTPSTINFSMYSDDVAQLEINGQKLISTSYNNAGTTNAFFSKAGFYAVDIIYSNTATVDGKGGATLKLTENNQIPNNFYQNVSAVPEPETYAMLLAGLGLMGFMSRCRKNS